MLRTFQMPLVDLRFFSEKENNIFWLYSSITIHITVVNLERKSKSYNQINTGFLIQGSPVAVHAYFLRWPQIHQG